MLITIMKNQSEYEGSLEDKVDVLESAFVANQYNGMIRGLDQLILSSRADAMKGRMRMVTFHRYDYKDARIIFQDHNQVFLHAIGRDLADYRSHWKKNFALQQVIRIVKDPPACWPCHEDEFYEYVDFGFEDNEFDKNCVRFVYLLAVYRYGSLSSVAFNFRQFQRIDYTPIPEIYATVVKWLKEESHNDSHIKRLLEMKL